MLKPKQQKRLRKLKLVCKDKTIWTPGILRESFFIYNKV